jgi:Type IV secretion system pilin
MSKKISKYLVFLVGFIPNVGYAATTFKTFADIVINLLNLGVEFLMGLALLGFVVGMIRFIVTAGDDKSRADGKQLMVWGMISLFVMLSVWGIVQIIENTFF